MHGRSSRRLTGITLAIGLALGPAATQAAVFFSEYVEGSGSNKALEIYNAGTTAVDLADYQVRVHTNGSATASGTVSLAGHTLPAGATLVMAHPSAVPALLALAQITSGNLNFNGDDAIALFSLGTAVDRIGQVGFDPGTGWASGTVSTVDRTLRRLSTVTAGDPDLTALFDPALGWEAFPLDTFSGLGQHASAAPGAPPAVPLPPSVALLLSALGGISVFRRKHPPGGGSRCLVRA